MLKFKVEKNFSIQQTKHELWNEDDEKNFIAFFATCEGEKKIFSVNFPGIFTAEEDYFFQR